jgi:signal transduction histidine kinase
LLLLPPILWFLWVLVGVALKPLQQVTHQLLEQHLNNLHQIDVKAIPVEIEPMVNALNKMISDLDAAYARERRFVSDASHELRNPLASLLINVENALEETQDKELTESLEAMRSSIQRLSSLVAQLLKLSRYENPHEQHDFIPCDLPTICHSVANELEPQLQQLGQNLELKLPASACQIMAVEDLLYSLVSNLLDNAIKHSGSGTTIQLECNQTTKSIELIVQDSGSGLNAEQMKRATDRFYRAGDTNAPGSGLGLAIVKSIAKIHDADVSLKPAELGGLKVTIKFKRGSINGTNL